MRASATSFRHHLGCGALVGAALGAAEGLAVLWKGGAVDVEGAASVLLAGALLAPAGALAGVVTALGARGLARAAVALSPARAVAVAITLALALAAAGAAASFYLRFSVRLTDETFSSQLAAFLAVAGGAALAALAWPFYRALARALAWLGARLPEAAKHAARLTLPSLLLGALAALLLWFARTHRDALGPLLGLPYLALLCVLSALAVVHRVDIFLDRGRRLRTLALVATLAFVASSVLSSALHRAHAVTSGTLGPSALAAALARATDVDRDGQSGLFGGRDCAPLDPHRSPLATEIPGNGVDEDCRGGDLPALPAGRDGGGAGRLPDARLSAEHVAKRDVFLIVIDALRADRIGYGAQGSLTPALDRLAARSIAFTKAYSQSSATRMSFPSFLSGKDPTSVRWRRQRGWVQLERDETMLAERLRDAGYQTGLVINRWIADRLTGLRRGYRHVQNTREVRGRFVAPEDANASSSARAIELVERNLRERPRKPMFLTVYYEGPHHPYTDHRARGLPARSKKARDRYDSEVRYVDQEVGHFIDYLEVQPELAGKSVIAVIADHGEELGEHGGTTHGNTCYAESTHVPFIVHAPGLGSAKVSARVGLVSLAPTLLALVGAEPLPDTDGRNLIGDRSESYARYPDERVRCAIFQDADPKGTLITSVRDGDHHYVDHFAREPAELYDTRRDPEERENLADDPGSAAVLSRLRALSKPVQIEAR